MQILGQEDIDSLIKRNGLSELNPDLDNFAFEDLLVMIEQLKTVIMSRLKFEKTLIQKSQSDLA